jgi:hypothetical protein
MRAIIIDDKDALALLDQLDLARMRSENDKYPSDAPPTFAEIHRTFHYVVVRWLQEQGASCVR